MTYRNFTRMTKQKKKLNKKGIKRNKTDPGYLRYTQLEKSVFFFIFYFFFQLYMNL